MRRWQTSGVLAGLAWFSAAAAQAQVQAIDPDAELNRDLSRPAAIAPGDTKLPPRVTSEPPRITTPPPAGTIPPSPRMTTAGPSVDLGDPPVREAPLAPGQAVQRTSETYRKDELVAVAQGVFGQGARNVAVAIGDVLKKQGEPNGYIVGQEGGGAFIFGLRYGSGTLHQKLQAERPVYWSGPSIGFDAGGSGGDTFVLVYNLSDPERLFKRFGAGEGQAYIVGGVNVGYLRSGNVVLIPVRMGVGVRLGVNAGYMKFSRRQNWVPF